jgi:uncharacterized iron-regulated membrane protein
MTFPYRLVHRVVGVCLAIPLLLLVVTGIPLQFTVWLGLGSTGVPFAWVHEMYGIAVPQTMRTSGGVVQSGELLFVGDRVETVSGELLGALRLEPVVAVATPDELLLVMQESDAPVERNPLPAHARGFGMTGDQAIAIDTSAGPFVSEDLGASWSQMPAVQDRQTVSWLQVETSKPSREFARRFGAANLSWERWLQDLHSGRFFGTAGVWLMNLASFVFIVLGFTGLVLWFTSRRVKTRR